MTKIKLEGFHYGYIIVFCCCLIMGVNIGLVMSCAGIFYHPVSEELGVTVGTFGLYMSFNYLASILMLSIAGKLMAQFSARILLTLSSGILGLCFVSMSFFNAVWQFYVAGSIIGITLAFLFYLSFPIMISRWFKTKVGFFIGICSAASGIGGILFNPLGAHLITTFGWRATYAIFGIVILLLVTPIVGILIRNYPKDKGLLPYGENEQQQTTASDADIEYAHAIRMPVFYCLLVFAFLIICVSTLNLFIPNYVTELGYTLQHASFVASAVMVGVTIGKVALGIINDKSNVLGVATTTVFGIIGLVLLLMGNVGVGMVATGGFFFGWAYAGVTVQTPILVRAAFGNKNYPQIYSSISIAFAVGGAITAGGWGLLADYTTFKFILSLGVVFLIILGIIGFYILTFHLNSQKLSKRENNT